jgi:hypothetical protein
LILQGIARPASAAEASGHFEWYCDGFGFYLSKIDGAPAPKELVLFLLMNLPPAAFYLPTKEWRDVAVYSVSAFSK